MSFSTRHAAFESTSIERRSGVFWSSVSPFHDRNTVGMQSVAPRSCRARNAGEVGSHAVYPRASNVERMPPLGNDEASGSAWMSWLPEKRWIASPSLVSVRKASCFSADCPFMGWNQCVKCVAPRASAHSFIPCATSSAIFPSSFSPRSIVATSFSKTGRGSVSRIASWL